jgi:hypothetical protein
VGDEIHKYLSTSLIADCSVSCKMLQSAFFKPLSRNEMKFVKFRNSSRQIRSGRTSTSCSYYRQCSGIPGTTSQTFRDIPAVAFLDFRQADYSKTCGSFLPYYTTVLHVPMFSFELNRVIHRQYSVLVKLPL